jgi:hypothetical protein
MARFRRTLLAAFLASALVVLAATSASAGDGAFVGPFKTITQLASTVPVNGDVNPYGVAVVPESKGRLIEGHVLVSNFNNSNNLQGTGTTIVQVAPGGHVDTFATIDAAKLPGACPGGVGLTTALSVLRSGWVIVGSLPTTDGTSATAQAGCLLVLNSQGQVVKTISGGPINGPWDMTAVDFGPFAELFVTNVLNGTVANSPNVVNGGTVVRIGLLTVGNRIPVVLSERIIGNGFPERTDPAALVVGPTGVGFADNTLYVADTQGNRIAAIHNALGRDDATTGVTVAGDHALNNPLGLAIAPNENILTVNANDGNLVETTPGGHQVAVTTLDTTGSPPGAGTLFGLALQPGGEGVYFVDDGSNTLNLLH